MLRFVVFAFSMLLIGAPASAQDVPARKEVNCESDGTTAEIRKRAEARCLAELKDVASRSGPSLRFKLQNGKTKTLRNKSCERDADTCTEYTLVGYHPAQRAFIVAQGFYEFYIFLLVDERTGDVTEIDGMPRFSPSGRWFVTADTKDGDGVLYVVAIWSTAADKPKQEFRYSNEKESEEKYEYWKFLGWDGDSRIKLKVSVKDAVQHYAKKSADFETDAVLTEQGWKLNWPKAEQ